MTDTYPRRHCWECKRRTLVCDFKRPQCNRCRASGVPCPGYGEAKPAVVKWLEPGQVKSRTRRSANRATGNGKETKPDKSTATDNNCGVVTKKGTSSSDDMAIPPLSNELKSPFHAMMEAVQYYNVCIYPDLLHARQIGTASFVYIITPELFQKGVARPDYLRLGIVCTAISHRMNRSRVSLQRSEQQSLEQTYLHYRGAIIRSLSISVGQQQQPQDLSLAGIMTLLLADAQHGIWSYRRWHLDGLRKLILQRGGVQQLGDSDGMKTLLLSYAFIVVIGDSTVPASDVYMDADVANEMKYIVNNYGDRDFALGVFPTALFIELININQLRFHSYQSRAKSESLNLSTEAYAILKRVLCFSPVSWASLKPSKLTYDWLLLSSIYQAAVIMYCAHSLYEPLSLLPESLSSLVLTHCTTYHELLHELLREAVQVPRFKTFLFWPLVVFGAMTRDTATRSFAETSLDEMSSFMGTSVPLVAKQALNRHWASAAQRWDDCFNQPYGFVTSLTLDKKGLD